MDGIEVDNILIAKACVKPWIEVQEMLDYILCIT